MKTLISALLLALVAATARAEPVTLNGSVSVNGNYVLLGDFFRNTGDKADAVVAYAPAPGKKAIFDARWLYRVAQKNRLAWRPITLRDRAVVRRESYVITRREIEDRILEYLRAEDDFRDIRVFLANRSLRLHVAGDEPATVDIEDLALDRRTNRFSALVVAPAGDPAAQRVRVTGRVIEMAEVPVLARRLLAGTVIRKGDIRWIKMRADNIQRDTITDAGDLIGMVPTRSLRDGRPIQISQVERPLMVAKGSLVTMVLRGPAMLLTAQGRAQESGSKGDVIRITNTQSKQVVEAVVTGPGTVVVRSASRLAMK
jgi:flagella basal body P-ring formation protein FlgA